MGQTTANKKATWMSERLLSAGQRPSAEKLEPEIRTSVYPYVAPHTAKIHTLITLGISIRTKLLVLKDRKRLPRGFDSHRPLHYQAIRITFQASCALLLLDQPGVG